MWQEAWRIFEIDKALMPKTLFHSYNGSRYLLLNTPLKAYQGIVSNPGKKTNTYRAGWHVGINKKSIEEYLKSFTANRKLCVCRVLVQNIRKKPRAKSPIYLAKEMMILSDDWYKVLKQYS